MEKDDFEKLQDKLKVSKRRLKKTLTSIEDLTAQIHTSQEDIAAVKKHSDKKRSPK